MTNILEKITSIIEKPLEDLGYELVLVKLVNQDILQILIDKSDGVNIDDCVKSTNLIRNLLYVANVEVDYSFEVSSPGIDRPLIKVKDFERFVGSNIKLTTNLSVNGRRKFIGKLEAFNKQNNIITLKADDDNLYEIALDNVKNANLKVEFK